MNIHEYQAKALFREFGIVVPEGFALTSESEVEELRRRLPEGRWVVKAQVHAGGRGKGTVTRDGREVGRGVQVHAATAAAVEAAAAMLGGRLVTLQTGAQGRRINRVLIEPAATIRAEYYLAAILDRESGSVALMASTEGGTEIEEVARTRPEKIVTVRVDPLVGFKQHHGRVLGLKLGLAGTQLAEFIQLVGALHRLFVAKDCSLAEINPLIVDGEGHFCAIDGKLRFDDNALFRHPELVELEDAAEVEPSELEAARANLSYIRLDGDIGCLVNGAGLAMATMDAIKDAGGNPANFLDVGGTATPENVARSFKLMLQDQVRGIFVNVFGGIVRCDTVAEGLVEALGRMKLEIPLVVRLEGNRKREAMELLERSGLPLITATDLKDGAARIVAACRRTAG